MERCLRIIGENLHHNIFSGAFLHKIKAETTRHIFQSLQECGMSSKYLKDSEEHNKTWIVRGSTSVGVLELELDVDEDYYSYFAAESIRSSGDPDVH